MDPTLEELMQKEFEAFEEMSATFIRYSLARNAVQNRLRDIHHDHPTLFDL